MELKEDVIAIQHAQEHGLTVANQIVVAIARQLRMRPARLIERTQACLPAVIEQQFYLTIAGDMAMKPETFANILRSFLGAQTLHVRDLERRQTGRNTFVSKFDDVADFVVGVTELCNKEVRAMAGYRITFTSAAKLLLEYGSVKNCEMIINSIVDDAWDIKEKLKINNTDPEVIITKAIGFLVNKIIPACHLKARPLPLRFMEYFERGGDGRLWKED